LQDRRVLRKIGCIIALLASAAAQAAAGGDLIAGVFTPARAAPDFSLRGSDGATLQLSHYRGKVVLLAFGYSSCHEVCPVTLALLAQARARLGVTAPDVQVVYVTVDPERDDAARMHQFLALFDRSFIGATGQPAELALVRKAYGIAATRHATAEGYVIAHSSFVYLIDRQGLLRALMPFGHGVDDFVHDLKLLLAQ
jgi:protein SCO1/2